MAKKNSFTYDDLIKCGHGTLFGSGRLPLPNMLMMDRIINIADSGGRHGKGEITAELDINPELWFFACHFEGDPVMPGCLGLDALWQLTGFFLSWQGHDGKGRALGVDEVRYTGQILPEAKVVTYNVDVRKIIQRKLTLIIADGTVSVDGREVYTAKKLRVGMFQSTEGF